MDNAYSLAKVLHEAPRLLELLSPDPRQPQLALSTGHLLPLMCTNSLLRQAVHSLVTGVHLQQRSDIVVLVKCHWQSLQTLSLIRISLDASDILQLARAHLPVLTSLDLSRNSLSSASIAYLTRAHWPLLQTLCFSETSMDAAGFRLLSNNNWPDLRCLLLQHVTVYNGELLSHGDPGWPKLKTLSLTGTRLGIGAIRWSSIHCPQLLNLQLGSTSLTSELFNLLMQANWPNLRVLEVGSNKLSNLNVHHFDQFCWSTLQEIDVGDAGFAGQSLCKLCAHMRPYIRKARYSRSTLFWVYLAGDWSNLEVLDVSHGAIRSMGDDGRYRYKWTKVKHLDFSYAFISLATLVTVECPLLETLDLSKVYMASLEIIVQGPWSKLKQLRLGYGLLPFSVSALVLANWPLLVSLHMQLTCYAQSQLDGVRRMIRHKWPCLKELALMDDDMY